MTTKLAVFNSALRLCGERKLASLSENREPRRLLDDEWSDGLIDYCLGAGQWKFARRTVEIASSVSITPAFGYRNAFEIPSDHVRTIALCSDEYLKVPLLDYSIEQSYWFADVDPIYVAYVSNGTGHGADLSLWPAEFTQYVEAHLASKIVEKLTQDAAKWDRVYKLAKQLRTEAASSDAMESPTTFPPPSNWALARLGRSRRDRGSRGSLIG